MLSLVKNNNHTWLRQYSSLLINYDIETWYNKQQKEFKPGCVINLSINHYKPLWFIAYTISNLESGPLSHYIYIRNVPVKKTQSNIYDIIDAKIQELLCSDGITYRSRYTTCILISNKIPYLYFTQSPFIELWIEQCDYIIRPNIKGNNIHMATYIYSNYIKNKHTYIDLTKSEISTLNISSDNYTLLPPFNYYIVKNFNRPKLII